MMDTIVMESFWVQLCICPDLSWENLAFPRCGRSEFTDSIFTVNVSFINVYTHLFRWCIPRKKNAVQQLLMIDFWNVILGIHAGIYRFLLFSSIDFCSLDLPFLYIITGMIQRGFKTLFLLSFYFKQWYNRLPFYNLSILLQGVEFYYFLYA